jgi:G6PDH family F420-dependent oxidoreductase
MVTRYGYTLWCEGNDPRDLVAQAIAAEGAGFDFLVISDHYHPWLPEQEHSGFAWSILGALAHATDTIALATMVTCPIIRYHPAIIAQAAATISVLSEGRFTLGLGAGERLNEHIVGQGWPPADVRHEMLAEAIEVIELLWGGGYVSHRGRYYTLEDARVFDLPEQPTPTYLAASGRRSAKLAADRTMGVCITEPDGSVVGAYREAGGDGTVWGQVVLSWADTEAGGLETAHQQFRFAHGGWKVQAELPNPVNFDAATTAVKPADLAEAIPAGPDALAHIDGMKRFTDAGVEHLAVAYPGRDWSGFMGFWQREMRPRL